MAAAAASKSATSTKPVADELVEAVVGPDPEKLAELDMLSRIEGGGGKWPVLRRRFEQGNSCDSEAIDVLKLILEVRDFLLTPLRAHQCTSSLSGMMMKQKPVIVIVGITGAGKSVTANWLLGRTVRKVKHDIPGADSDDEQCRTTIEIDGAAVAVGDDLFKSKTFAPNIIDHADFTLVDFPGFCDTNGFEVRLGMDLAFREMLNFMQPAHVLCLMQIESFSVGRGEAARCQLDKVRRLLPLTGCHLSRQTVATPDSSCTWLLGITKCDKDLLMNSKAAFDAATTFVQNWDLRFPASSILNINKLMFFKDDWGHRKQASARADLVRRLISETKTPNQPLASIEKQVALAFGEDTMPRLLASDCLSVADTQKLSQVMREKSFESILYDGLEKKELTGSATQAQTESRAGIKTWDEARFKESWTAAEEDMALEIVQLTQQTQLIKKHSEHLKNTRQLGLEMMSVAVRGLCSTAQPGLKLAFVDAEKQIMLRNMVDMVGLHNNLIQMTEKLFDCGCLQKTAFEEVQKEALKVKGQLDVGARTLGFKGADDLYCIKSAVGGTAMVAVGGVGMYMGAAGAVAEAGGIAFAHVGLGFVAGGLILVVGLVLGIQAAWRSKLAVEYSLKFQKNLTNAFSELGSTSEAVLAHRTNLEAVETHLKNLVLL